MVGKVCDRLALIRHLIPNSFAGQSQFLTSPMPAQPIAFNLSLDDTEDDVVSHRLEDNDSRLMEMLAAQAAHRETSSAVADDQSIISDKLMTESEKRASLQRALHNAASNGDVDQVQRLLGGPAKDFVDINGPDEEGTAPMIYASCFVSFADFVTGSYADVTDVDCVGPSGRRIGTAESRG